MSGYSFSLLLAVVSNLLIGFFVFIKKEKDATARSFFILTIVLSLWLLGCFGESISKERSFAIFWDKVLYTGVALYPLAYFYFLFPVLDIKRNKKILAIFSMVSLLFLILNYSPLRYYLIQDVTKKFTFRFIAEPNIFWFILILFVMGAGVYGALLKFRIFREATTSKQNQLKYLFIAYVILTAGGGMYFLLPLSIITPPIDASLVVIFSVIMAYAITRHRLMDIRVVLTRAGIFILVYSCVFALPIWLGIATKLWLLSVILMGILSPIGIFVHSYLRQQVENVIFKQQQRYQQTLKGLARRIMQIRELDVLLKTVLSEVDKVVRPEFIGLYIFSKPTKAFLLDPQSMINNYRLPKEIAFNSVLVERLSRQRKPLLIESAFNLELPFETLIVPYFVETSLHSFMLLGPKPKGAFYIESDFLAFEILSAQVSLAIETCIFWQDERTRLAKEEQIRRQRAMDHFSASLAHEIDNPIQVVIGMAYVISASLNEDLKSIPPDKKQYITDRLSRLIKNVERISKMIRTIREFSGQTTGEQELLALDNVLDDFLNIIEPQLKYEGIIFKKEITPQIKLMGNKIHLEEVLVNLATNAIHAVKHNNQKEKVISLKVYKISPNNFRIEFRDNGYGIKKELLQDIFLDFVTTKASSEGTGMGLARVRKIIENHNGKIWAESEGSGKGATFLIELPIKVK